MAINITTICKNKLPYNQLVLKIIHPEVIFKNKIYNNHILKTKTF